MLLGGGKEDSEKLRHNVKAHYKAWGANFKIQKQKK